MAIQQDNLERVGPRLRVVCNGDAEVNGIRAEISGSVEADAGVAKRVAARAKLERAVSRPKDYGKALKKPPSGRPPINVVRASCFVRLATPDTRLDRLPGKPHRRGDRSRAGVDQGRQDRDPQRDAAGLRGAALKIARSPIEDQTARRIPRRFDSQ